MRRSDGALVIWRRRESFLPVVLSHHNVRENKNRQKRQVSRQEAMPPRTARCVPWSKREHASATGPPTNAAGQTL
jgi:hypothetical protein